MSPLLPTIFIRNNSSTLPSFCRLLHLPKITTTTTTTTTTTITNPKIYSRPSSQLSTSTTAPAKPHHRPQLLLRLRTEVSLAPKRTMSSTTPAAGAKREFLVIVPDKKGQLARRNEVRDQHLTAVKPLVEEGFITLGGALMESHPEDGEAPQMNGSMLVAVGESAEKVREQLAKDIYVTSGVWDFENVQIIPVRLLPQEIMGLRKKET